MQKILIAGATGYGNQGDDAIRNRIAEHLAARGDCEIKATRPHPQRALIDWCDKLVLGGGGIIYDHPTDAAAQQNFTYYVDNYLRWALDAGKPVALCSVGIQALTVDANAARLGSLLAKCHHVSVRQPEDAALLAERARYADAQVADDLGFLTPRAAFGFTAASKRPKLCLVPHALFLAKFGEASLRWLVEQLRAEGYELYVALTASEDSAVGELLAGMIGEPGSVRDYLRLTDRELVALFAEMDAVISARFHGLVFATVAGTPTVLAMNRPSKIAQQIAPEGTVFGAIKHQDRKRLLASLKASPALKRFAAPQTHLELLDRFIEQHRGA